MSSLVQTAGRIQPVVVGPGRVGRAISSMHVPPARLVGKGGEIPGDCQGPIWVATTNDALPKVLAATPLHRRQDLVLLQNGMLLPWLRQHALEHSTTQVLLYMSASEDGKVVDGKRSVACGPWAGEVQRVLVDGGISCVVEPCRRTFRSLMLVKLLWACIFWVMSAALGGMPVGHVVAQHRGDMEALVAELLPLGLRCLEEGDGTSGGISSKGSGGGATGSGGSGSSGGTGSICSSGTGLRGAGSSGPAESPSPADASINATHICQGGSGGHGECEGSGHSFRTGHGSSCTNTGLDLDQVCQALADYSMSIAQAVPSAEMALREWQWRNGFFLGQAATPLHLSWLRRAGCPEALLVQEG